MSRELSCAGSHCGCFVGASPMRSMRTTWPGNSQSQSGSWSRSRAAIKSRDAPQGQPPGGIRTAVAGPSGLLVNCAVAGT